MKASGKYDEYKTKKAAAEKNKRNRVNSGLEQLPKAVREKTKRLNRAYSRKKAAEYRQRKKGLTAGIANVTPSTAPSKSEESYKTSSALTKAVAKVKRALPSTSAKKKEVVAKLLLSFDVKDRQEIVSNKAIEAKPTKGVSSNVVELVQCFYERDDISRMSPNMRDCRKFVDPVTGANEVKQIRYLMHKLSDVYSMFITHIQNGKLKSAKSYIVSSDLSDGHIRNLNGKCKPIVRVFSSPIIFIET